jgi:lipopolysaccharide export system protein LptA
MPSNFCALPMPDTLTPPLRRALVPLLLAAAAAAAWAEKADRALPMVVEADKPGTMDMQRQIMVFSGNVVIVQGTTQIRAERVEVRESKDGQRTGTAIGTAAKRAWYREKRDGLDEFVEGEAERIDFDTRADSLRFTGQAVVRRLRGAELVDEITGQLITWNNTAELFTVEGGATPTNPSGRVRAVIGPRTEAPRPAPGGATPRAGNPPTAAPR